MKFDIDKAIIRELGFVLLILIPHVVSGQLHFHTGIRLTEQDGLPGRTASALAEDKSGFIWIGGPDGLARYDGMTFKNYRRKEDQPTSLIDNRVRCLLADGHRLWIGTQNGLSVMDMLTEKCTNYQFDSTGTRATTDMTLRQAINTLHKDSNGNIWIGSGHWGAIKYDPAVDTFIVHTIKPEDIPSHVIHPNRLLTVMDFADDIHDKEILWIGLYAGLAKMNTRTGVYRLYTFPFPNKEEQISRNAFRTIYQHDDGKIYTGAWFNVMQVFDPLTGKLTALPQEFIHKEKMEFMSVREIHRATDHTIWITTNMGVLTYHTAQQTYLYAWKNNEKDDLIYAIDFMDSQGCIYTSSDGGLTIYDPLLQNFVPISFAHLNPDRACIGFDATYDDRHGHYLVCPNNTNSLFRFNPRSMEWSRIFLPHADTIGGQITALLNIDRYKDDQYIIASTQKLYFYDARTEKIQEAPIQLPVDVPRIRNAYVDSRSNVWIATVHDGVLQWNTTTNTIRQFTFPSDPEFAAGHEDTFLEDREGNLWIKCRNAFVVYTPLEDTLTYYKPDDLVTPFYNTFAMDSKGNIWLASTTGWVGRVDLSLKEIIAERYSMVVRKEGLITFQIDRSDHIWCALPDRLIRIDIGTKEQTLFPYSPALKASNIFSFKYMQNHRLIFTALDQIFITDPDHLKVNTTILKPYPTHIDIREQPLISDTVVHRLTSLQLDPAENFFSISFSALGAAPGESYSFRYRLSGFQDEWIVVTDRWHANFTNVPSGKYVFELQAAGMSGEFNSETYTLPVYIEKPFIERTWVRLAGLAFLIAFIQSIYKYRIHQIRKEERLKTEFQQQLASAETNALRAQMNPHFIFNSLNSIENYILKNDPEKAALYLNDFARLIRLILQNSRSRHIPLKTELDTLELYLEMEKLRFADKLDYTIAVDDKIQTDLINIPPMLIQPFVENAIWHGLMPKPEGGRVNISITIKEQMLWISVEDNGIGREKSAEIHARKKQGDPESFGMRITKDRIKLLNKIHETEASVTVTDLKDNRGMASGTRVDITLPL